MENTADKKPLNIIEALAGGFELILQNPWIVLVPILLDLFVWLGPQISAKPIFDQFIVMLNDPAVVPTNASPDALENWNLLKTGVQSLGDASNLWGIITTGLPTLFWIVAPVSPSARAVLNVDASPTLALIMLPLTLLGVFFTAVYFEAMARAVRQETTFKNWMPRFARHTGTIFVLLFVLTLAALGVMIPVSIGATLLALVSQGVASLVMLLGLLMLVWAMLYLAFALASIFVSHSNAMQAIFNSISLFRFDFWSSMGLVVVTYLIRWGFTFVWQFFINNPWGILFDIIGNAFLGSGLTAAMLIYYADRMSWLTRLRERIRQHMQFKV